MATTSEALVPLRGGLTVPDTVLATLLSIEARGGHVAVLDADIVRVTPKGLVTDDDRAAIRRWKPHVLAVLDYVQREAWRSESPASLPYPVVSELLITSA